MYTITYLLKAEMLLPTLGVGSSPLPTYTGKHSTSMHTCMLYILLPASGTGDTTYPLYEAEASDTTYQ